MKSAYIILRHKHDNILAIRNTGEINMFEKRITVIGGSIAGCAIAVLLQRSGFRVTVLERSAGMLHSGSGITLPEALVDQCINLGLLDKDIPGLAAYGRFFARKQDEKDREGTIFWQQPLNVLALNWISIYQNLRKRISPDNYHNNTNVLNIYKKEAVYFIETSTKITWESDFIIAADGVDSSVRSRILPEISPKYAGYIAWRGVTAFTNDTIAKKTDAQIPYVMFSGGHLLLYRIPCKDYNQTGKTLLNWVMYEDRQTESLSDLLVDNIGKKHTRSLPAGLLSEGQVNYLHALSSRVLPSDFAEIINNTPQPFIQAVFDFQPGDYPDNKLIFIGDAASTLRPHSGSGVLKALSSSIALFNIIKDRKTDDLSSLFSLWQGNQENIAKEEISKAMTMGRGLVTESPDWQQMNQVSTDEWWLTVMQGKTWYATRQVENPLFFNKYSSCDPERSNNLQNHHLKQAKL